MSNWSWAMMRINKFLIPHLPRVSEGPGAPRGPCSASTGSASRSYYERHMSGESPAARRGHRAGGSATVREECVSGKC